MQSKSNSVTLGILTSLFFMWGFITCLNDILIPHLKAVFDLNYAQAMLVQFCFFAAYFLMSVPSGYLVERLDYKGGIVSGLMIAGLGCLLFYPAAALHQYVLFLLAFFILASGITLLQVAANPYVTVLGKPETASSRLTLTQAFNALGTTLAPYLGAGWILSEPVKSAAEIQALSVEQLQMYQAAEAALVQAPYLGLAAVLGVLALLFAVLKLPSLKTDASSSAKTVEGLSVLRTHPHLFWGVVAIFVYVGGEVSIGSFMVSFLSSPDVGGLSEQEAGRYVAWYWGGAMLGRFVGAFVMQHIRAGWVLAGHAVVAVALIGVASMSAGALAMWSILAVGLCNSVMFPTIFSMALTGLGRHAGQGSGLLCSAIVGGALVPVLQGLLADTLGLQLALLLPMSAYAYIAYYGWRFRNLTE